MRADAAGGGRHAERGFTLLETLVALAVLGIVLGTLYQLAGDTMVQYRSREAQLRLALTAEAAFNAERLEAGSADGYLWPEGFGVTVERQALDAAAGLDELAALGSALSGDLDWLVVEVVDPDGRSFTLEGAVRRLLP
jgi:prepilin-type N-terminal cleavage/methylation domain-containing protein